MGLRSRRALTFLILLASAAPPPRVTNALIVAMHRHESDGAGKTVQSRARNRIGEPIQVAARRTVAGISDGRPRPASPLARDPGPSTAFRLGSPPPALLAPLHLRC